MKILIETGKAKLEMDSVPDDRFGDAVKFILDLYQDKSVPPSVEEKSTTNGITKKEESPVTIAISAEEKVGTPMTRLTKEDYQKVAEKAVNFIKLQKGKIEFWRVRKHVGIESTMAMSRINKIIKTFTGISQIMVGAQYYWVYEKQIPTSKKYLGDIPTPEDLGSVWEKSEDDYLVHWWGKKLNDEIALHLGKSVARVEARAKVLGLSVDG